MGVKHLSAAAWLIFGLGLPVKSVLASGGDTEETSKAAITKQLHNYQEALNNSDIQSVMALYADDAVFMPQHSLPSVGRVAVNSAYQQVFQKIKLNIRFTIDEVQLLSKDWAYARTRSTGTVQILSGNSPLSKEANQELFLLHKEPNGQWRFARYIFTTTNPAH